MQSEPQTGRRRAIFQLVAGALLFLALDGVLFRSGWYFGWIRPQSSLGSVAQAIDNTRHVPAGRRAVLVMGDSRIGEGFSMPIANDVADRNGQPYVFANGADGGSMPRIWNYLLRDMLPPAERLAAVAVMVTSYRDDEAADPAARRSDIALVHPLLKLADLPHFPWSFPDPDGRGEAVTAMMLRGLYYKSDVQDLLWSPGDRIRAVIAARRHGFAWASAYPGRQESLEGIGFDPASGTLSVPEGHPAASVPTLPGYAEGLGRHRGRPPVNASAASYRRTWLERIAEQCREARVRLFVFRIPRGPLHGLMPDDAPPEGVLAELAREGRIEVLPAELFAALERPEYFFDDLHVNAVGRARLSAGLAEALLARLAEPP